MKARATSGSKPGPKGKGIFRIIEFDNDGGTKSFRVTGWTMDGKRIRQNYADHAAAAQRLAELETQAADIKDSMRPVNTRLTPEQAAEAEAAFAAIAGKAPLMKVVRYYLDNYREPVTQCTVQKAFTEFIAEKRAANKRPLTIRNLQLKCRELLLIHGNKNVSEVGEETARDLIFKPDRGPVARDNYRRALNGFFAWAKDQGYTEANPIDAIDRIEADESDPKVLTLDECTRLLNAAATHKDGKLVPFVSLALFAGLRPDQELKRISWADIDIDNEMITVSGKVAKMRGKRVIEAVRLTRKERGKEVKLPSNLFEWLRPYINKTPIKGKNWRRDFDAVKLAAGFGTPDNDNPDRKDLKPWIQDYMRHTAISYHFAHCEHEGKTAKWAGNSPDMVHRKYKGLVKPADVPKFWSIRPAPVSNLIPLKQEAA